ncbi:alpha/beta hydrolase [Siphonobacter aquaeclarae]|uniref:Enterochelin esterase n=1 Tax=Siphonobacter aquaeclarae TaxID=563176 RepID=A0A1G9RXK3_9BACT|nr:alpha/beta hydrolase-fold protein [Siphonobacter aquaeclarae]SDM27750.1 Enterochelin esterase [Siphonobacter aquaeclarae]
MQHRTVNSAFIQSRTGSLASRPLQRQVILTVLLPPGYDQSAQQYPLLLVNDGQDFERLQLKARLESLMRHGEIPPLVVVGVHANERRLSEYGTAGLPDYKGRGNLASAYTQFIIDELIPHLEHSYRVNGQKRYFAGFSLGGLSALDICWQHDTTFAGVGIFSGSLWWRSRAYDEGYDDENDRIMHVRVRNTTAKPALRFWFQAGTDDEQEDRNQNGIIDAIDDTLDLMRELQTKGYRQDADYTYLEVSGGQHNPETWGAVFPDFLRWVCR